MTDEANFTPDWRWLLDRADSPWYPSARLYRQPAFADWKGVFRKIAEDLELAVQNRSIVTM